MTIRNWLAVLTTAWAGISTLGCGAAPDSSQAEVSSPEEVDGDIHESSDAIRGGVEGGGVGAVDIQLVTKGCTGVLLGTSMILTSSSCFDGILGANVLQGTVSAKINYAVTGTSWRCMTGAPANGKCTENRSVFVRRTIASTAPRPDFDYAVVFMNSTGAAWANVTASDAASGFYDGTGVSVNMPYTFFGRGYLNTDGTGAGVMRFMTDLVDAVKTNYFTTEAGAIRLCLHDFGGPFFLSGGSNRWVFGIASSAQMSGNCATNGGTQRGTLTGWAARNAINGWRTAAGLPACTPFSAAFPNHWVCS